MEPRPVFGRSFWACVPKRLWVSHILRSRNIVAILVLLWAALLNGCIGIEMPTGPRQESYVPRGLVLEESATVALVVSTSVQPIEQPEYRAFDIEIFPIATPEAVTRGFTEGFHKLRPDVTIRIADEAMIKTCFSERKKILGASGALMLIPGVSAAECHAFADARTIRYLISLGGEHLQYTWEEAWTNRGATWNRKSTFSLYAWAFDITTTESRCSAEELERAETDIHLGWWYVPFGWTKWLDEAAFWKRVAYQAGYKIAGCFLPLETKQQPR